jgi:D-arginine dehydrogenase
VGVVSEHLTADALRERCPAIGGGRASSGLWLPEGGVLDIHHLSELLRRELRRAGATQRLSAEVKRVTTTGGRVSGAELISGETLLADRVVIAAGAWASALGEGCGAPLGLVPHRRHLALLMPAGERRVNPSHPVVWNVESGIYFRPESGGVLACPGDHEPNKPGVPSVDDGVLATLASELPKEAPVFDGYALARSWACLRTVSDTKETVLGEDPRVHGLFWLAGLGGHGMSAALGAADYLADAMAGASLPDWCSPLQVRTHLERATAASTSPATKGS